MAKQNTIMLPLANYPNGQQQGTLAIPDAATHAGFWLQRCTSTDPTIWPNASTTISVLFELQIDGGGFQFFASFAAAGGIARDGENGPEIPNSGPDNTMTLWPGINRRMRITAIVAGGPLRTQGTGWTR